MGSHGTASLTVGQFAEFASAVVSQLAPAIEGLDSGAIQNYIENREELAEVLRVAFSSSEEMVSDDDVETVETPAPATTSYRLAVNYDEPVETLVKQGAYDYAHPDITTGHFPTTRTGTAELDLTLVHFGRDISTEDALAELDRMGYRAAELKELLALGAKHPDLQREFPTVALSSVWRNPNGSRHCAFLDGDDAERILFLGWALFGWSGYCRFAAVRK